jgi:transmembrane sensor
MMENQNNKIKELLNKVEWTQEEKQWLSEYLGKSGDEELKSLLRQQFEMEANSTEVLHAGISDKMLRNIHERIGVVKPIKKTPALRIWALSISAACIVALVLFAYPMLTSNSLDKTPQALAKADPKNKTLAPGGSDVILTLADGSTIVLDDKQDGLLTNQGNTKVLKFKGKLVYNSTDASSKEVSYNTITTPAGGQYQVELPDGSLVWLNAGSSLRFPTAFTGSERRVEVSGEAYFEVARMVTMPFTVKVNKSEVQVLGTKFNIMAYEDEAMVKTTLLHGEVKFVNGSSNTILNPGQQTQLSKAGKVKVLSGVDVDEVMAWKNGMFDFEGADLETVARHLSRWYDVEMVFDKKNDDLFYAKIPRETKLKDVLKALELTGKVHFTIQGKKIMVKPFN